LSEIETRWRHLIEGSEPVRCLGKLRAEIEDMPTPVPITQWSGYYDRMHNAAFSPEKATPWSYKPEALDRILDDLSPSTAIDLASNTGQYAALAADKGIDVIALDRDDSCTSRLFNSILGAQCFNYSRGL
jgi:hypothetical protein